MNLKDHLLTCLAEEGAEVAQQVAKCQRFGMDDRNVLHPEGPTNWMRLVDELNDLIAVAELLAHAGILPLRWQDDAAQIKKLKKVRKFIDYAQKTGALEIMPGERSLLEIFPKDLT